MEECKKCEGGGWIYTQVKGERKTVKCPECSDKLEETKKQHEEKVYTFTQEEIETIAMFVSEACDNLSCCNYGHAKNNAEKALYFIQEKMNSQPSNSTPTK